MPGSMVTNVATISGLCAAAAVLLVLIVRTYLSYTRLRHIPGPWYVGVTPLWLAYHTLKCDVYRALKTLTDEYGTLTRIAPNIIITTDPVLYRLMSAPRAPFIRGWWFEGMKIDPRLENSTSMVDEKAHAALRSKLTPGYNGKDVTTLEADIDSQIQVLSGLIEREYVNKNQSFDFARIITYFTLDVLSQIGFGSIFGFLENNRDMFDYHKTTKDFFPILELGSNWPIVLKVLQSRILQALAGPKPSDRVGLGAIMGKTHQMVAERFGPDAKPGRNDMLGSFIKNGLTQEECESESVIQIMAGSDSTATALRVTFWHIMSTPSVYIKLMKEMEAALERGDVSHPVIQDTEAKSLPYLQACIKEGLRMFMPLNGLITRVCPPDGFTWDGTHIPAGTQIGLSIYSMNRRKDIYGPDADTYRPERFIEEAPEKIKELERVQELVFGSGRHGCLGKQIALMELGKALFELFKRFEFTIVNPLDAVNIRSSGVVLISDMNVRARMRKLD